jgi:hypothetical protein
MEQARFSGVDIHARCVRREAVLAALRAAKRLLRLAPPSRAGGGAG